MIKSIKHVGLCPKDRAVTLARKTILTGPVGAGKSTLLRAVQMAMGADPPKGAAVTLETTDGAIQVSAVGKNVLRGGPRPSHRAVLAVNPVALGESADSAAQLLAQLAEETIDRPALVQQVRAMWPDCGEPSGSVAVWLGGLIETLESESRSESAQSGKITTQEVGVDPAVAREILATMEAQHCEAAKEHADVAADLRALSCELTGLGPAAELDPGVSVDAAELAVAEAEIAAQIATDEKRILESVSYESAAAAKAIRDAYEQAVKAYKALDSVSDTCPTCGCDCKAAQLRETASEKQAAMKPELMRLHAAAKKAVALSETATGDAEKAATALALAVQAHQDAKKTLHAARACANSGRRAEVSAKIDVLKRRETELRNTLTAIDAGRIQARATVELCDRAAESVARKADLKASAEKKRNVAAQLRDFRAMIVDKVVSAKMGQLEALMGAPCRLGAEARGKSGIEVQQGDQWLPWSSLSDGQRIRFFVSLAILVGGPPRLLWVDRAECLGNELAQVLEIIEEQLEAGTLSQAVVSGHILGMVPGWEVVAL